MALIGALLLVFTIFIRPQEFVPALANVPLLNIAVILAVLGVTVDFFTGKLKGSSPQIPFLFAFLAWAVFATFLKVGLYPVLDMKLLLGFPTIFMFVVMYAGRSFAKFRTMALLLLGISIGLSTICIQQGRGEFECILLEKDEFGSVGDESHGASDGRPCESRHQCDKDSDAEYVCEKSGMFDTFTVANGRVRWRGTFADPNELALAVGAAMSFAFAVHASMRNMLRHLFLAGALGLAGYCVVLTGSRGGVLVLLSIFGTYFVRRYGWKGAIAAGMAGLPVLMLGGRKGEDAEASSLERLGALYDGIDFVRENPFFGLGSGQFVENYFITAHNSYLLSAAELGIPGMILWTLLVYISVKIPYMIATHPPPGLDPRLPAYGMALVTSFAGILIGIFFLSFCYHPMLFIYFGLAGALYGVAKQSARTFHVGISKKEFGILVAFDFGLLAFLFVYTRIKGSA